MPAEQPPKTICEICGSAHSTSAHVSTVENLQEEKSAQEKEPNREAMKKVVDFFATEDLKYRFVPPETIITTLETGLPTPLTSFLYEPFRKIDEETRRKMAEIEKNRDQERSTMTPGIAYEGYAGGQFRQKANVLYPEGLLKTLRDKLIDTQEIEMYGQKTAEEKDFTTIADGGMLQLIRAYFSLSQKERETIVDLIGTSESQINISFGEWLESAQKNAVLIDTLVKKLLSEPQAWTKLRTAWLEIFFGVRTNEDEEGARRYGLAIICDRIQNRKYHIKSAVTEYLYRSRMTGNIGFVLSPNTKVAVSPHIDFPEQATLMESRVKPKDIIGIFVREDFLDQMRNKKFRPPDALLYLIDKFPRPFFYFLTKQHNIDEEKLKALLQAYKEEYERKAYADNLRDDDGKIIPMYQLNIEHPKIARMVRSGLQYRFPRELLETLNMLSRKFIEEKSPVKDDESLIDGLQRVVAQYQLPIYNTRGELLWPKHMTHEQVAEFVAEKSGEKE